MSLRYRIDELLMSMRLETKAEENEGKPPAVSPDLAETRDFEFSPLGDTRVEDGQILLAHRRGRRKGNYLVKQAYTDLACNEFVHSKLLTAMGLCTPGAVLLKLSEEDDRPFFSTEYIVAIDKIEVVKPSPVLAELRERAANWRQLFSFRGLYAMLGEAGGMATPLANDGLVYRVDARSAFPVRRRMLDYGAAGFGGAAGALPLEDELAAVDVERVFDEARCDMWLDKCLAMCPDCRSDFLVPFEALGQIEGGYIDDFLNTLCYIYPDALGDFYGRLIEAVGRHAARYFAARR